MLSSNSTFELCLQGGCSNCAWGEVCYQGRCCSPYWTVVGYGGGCCSFSPPCTTKKPKGKPDLKGTGGIISVFKNAETGQWDVVPEASSGTNPGSFHHNRYVKLSWNGISDWGENCGRGSHHYEVQIRESGNEAGQEIPFILAKHDAVVGEKLIAEDNPDDASEVWYYYNHECMGLNSWPGVDCKGYCYYNTDSGIIEPNQTADGRFCESDADSELVSCSCGSGSEDYIPCETGNGTNCVIYQTARRSTVQVLLFETRAARIQLTSSDRDSHSRFAIRNSPFAFPNSQSLIPNSPFPFPIS